MSENGLLGSNICMHNPQLTMKTIRKGLGGVALLQEVFNLDGFQVSKAQPGPVSPSLCLLPADQDGKLSATAPAPCLSASHHDGHELAL